MAVWRGLTNSCEKKEARSKRETERYTHLNAEFQRIARTDKKAFLSDWCKEIEENNRMGKTRDLFKKITDTKGTLHVKMGTIKDRNCLDLTEAEDIKKRWQEYTEELYKKDLHVLDIQASFRKGRRTRHQIANIRWIMEKAREFQKSIYFCFIGEKVMAPHSSTLAWKIPWMDKPGRLQSMGSLRVGHDWATSLSLFTFMPWRRKWQPTPVFLPG